MAHVTQAVESILEEIELEIVDPFDDGSTQYMYTTVPIPPTTGPTTGTPPPQHTTKCAIEEAQLRMRQKAAG